MTIVYCCIAGYLLIINIIAFAMYGADKRKAKNNEWRTPEKTLIGVAAIGGSIGALLGMKVFRHKTKHPQFVYGIPAILVVHVIIAAIVVYWLFFKS